MYTPIGIIVIIKQGTQVLYSKRNAQRACFFADLINQKGIEPAIPLLNELGGWPILGDKPGGGWREERFDLARLITTLRKYNNKVLIDMGVDVDDMNSTQHIISFSQQEFGMPSREYYLQSRYRTLLEAYITLARDIAIVFGANTLTAEREIRDAVDFEIAIANISLTQEEMRDTYATYNRLTLDKMAVNFTEPGPQDPIQFNWANFTRGVFDLGDGNVTIEDNEPVLIRSVKYFEKVLGLVQRFPKRTIANYMVWRIIQNRARNLNQTFQDIIGEYNKVMYGQNSQEARWKSCMGYTILQLGQAVGSLYVRQAFDEAAKGTALDMIHGIRDAFAQILLEEEWMDESTRKKAKEKVEVNSTEYFRNVLGNLHRWGTGDLGLLRLPYNKNGWSDPPTTVNAAYSFLLNNIQFPAGIFQPPFYQKDQPRSMNYGGIGVVIGHEITHGFDDQGSRYDKDGNLRNWWDTSILENFHNKSQCIVDQYGNFQVPDVGLTVNGLNTLGENIADNGGLKQSFRAYRKWVAEVGHEEPLLPGVNFTHNQLFFLNFAQVWCDKEKPEALISLINTDPHSPAQFRVIGTLQNSKDFAETFQCRPGTFMNPAKKCSVW
ncbi:neprilysin-4-like isoform X2 [Dreissena polymorpha]|uniref:neprilysin-4-like isoform X2 n=1 Tax=Dreissena polymorpha TaxID=45954 RepID=UPI002264CD4C|nr:neprilysin-4-like isoform X2 [Dreissena polymorpha]